MVATVRHSLEQGVYSFAEAGRLTDVSTRTVRAWFEGRRRDGKVVGGGRVFRGDYPSGEVISFLDLIEVLVAGHLRQTGISLDRVRNAHRLVSEQLSTPHPFSRREILTDGENIFVRTAAESNDEQLLEVFRGQLFFPKVMRPYLSRVEYDPRNRLASAWNIADGVVLDPRRSRGKPILESSAMPVSVLAAAYEANGRDADAVADWYGVSPEDVTRAVNFAASH